MSEMKSYYSHPTAVIDEGATIGKGCRIWHFCHIMPRAFLGDNCSLGQNVFVGDKVSLGRGCKVQNNVSLYEGVQCEDYVFIGPSAVFTNVINPRSFIERKEEFRHTFLREGASIGANATIVCGVEIGEYSLVAAGAVVTHSVKPYTIVGGTPAKEIGYISKVGGKLLFEKKGTEYVATCPISGERYILDQGNIRPFMGENKN